MSSLAAHFQAGELAAHSVSEDIQILQALTAKELKKATLETSRFSLAAALERNSKLNRTAELPKTFTMIVEAKMLSKGMASRAAESGLALGHV